MRPRVYPATSEDRYRLLDSLLREAQEVGVSLGEAHAFSDDLRALIPEWTEGDPIQPGYTARGGFRALGEPYLPDAGPNPCTNLPALAARFLALIAEREDAPSTQEIREWMPETLAMAQQHREEVAEERRLERGL